MPPRRRRVLHRPPPSDYVPGGALRLAANYTPGSPSMSGDDPTSGFGYRRWNEEAPPLTGAQKTQTFGAPGTLLYQGVFDSSQYGIEEPEEWQGDNRWKTIAAMRRDGQVSAVTNVCVLPLLQATYSINPGNETDADVALAQDVADNLLHDLVGGWHALLRRFYTNRFENGHYLGEKTWTTGSDGVRLRKVEERPAETLYRWFPDEDGLNRVMQKVWKLNEGGVNGQWMYPLISKEKFVFSPRNMRANDFRGSSLLYPMLDHWDFKHKLYWIDGVANERNGMGVPVLEDPPVVRQQSDRDQAAVALENYRVGENAYMDIPNGYKFTLTGVSGGVRDIWPSIQHHDLLMARSALAHFINLDAYGQLTISGDAQTLFLSSEEAEGVEAVDCVNLLIREWVDYNYENVDRYPTIAITGIGSRNLDAALRGIAALFQAKILTYNVETENAIRDDVDLPALPADASAAGGGAVSVDPDSQGKAPVAPGEAAPTTPGATAKQDLAFKPLFAAGELGPRAIHLSGKRLKERRFTTYMSGAYPKEAVAS